MSRQSGPGRVYNRRVTRHIDRVLPDRIRPDEDFSFEGSTILDRENNPGKPAGGTCRIKCYVGEDGQIAVLEKSELTSQGEINWACWNRVRRSHAVDGTDLPPFQYHVQTQIINQGERKRDETILSLAGFEMMPVHGGREVQAALLLAESLAVERAVSPRERSDVCCSLHNLPSLPRVIDNGNVIRLNWREVNDLIGPDSEMIAPNVDIDPVPTEERTEAEAKGVKIFTQDGDDPDDLERNSEKIAKIREQRLAEISERETDPQSLPEDMDPEAAEEKILEMAEEIYEMRMNE